MSFSSSIPKGPKTARDDSNPSMLEAYIYSTSSTVERIAFGVDTANSAAKRNSEMEEDVEKLREIVEKNRAKNGSNVKL